MLKVITPVQIKLMSVHVVVIDFNVIEHQVPGHVLRLETFAPRVKRRSPEVHSERLGFAHVSNGRVGAVSATHLLIVHAPAHILRGPLDSVGVPFVLWIKVSCVFVRFELHVAVTVDHVCRGGLSAHRRYNLNIKFVPATWRFRTILVCEE